MSTVLSFLSQWQLHRFGSGAAVCLLTGVCLGLFGFDFLPGHLVWSLIAIGSVLWLWCTPLRWPGLLLLGLGLSQWHASQVMTHTLPADWDRRVANVTAVVTGLPEVEADSARWIVRVVESDAPMLAGQTVRVSWYPPRDPTPEEAEFSRRIHVGQTWRFSAELRAPRSLINRGAFDSERNAFAKRIVAMARIKSVDDAVLLSESDGLGAWRERMSARIERKLHHDSSRFIRALALGDTRAINDDDWTVLRNDGLTHLIAISGSHVGFVGAMFALLGSVFLKLRPGLLRVVPRPVALSLLGACGGIVYAVVTGNEVPTVRTASMMMVVALTLLLRRKVTALDTLAMVAILMLLWDPLAVMTAGFWLSFLGVGWLMTVMPSGREKQVTGFLRTQFVATFALMPIAVLLFGQVSMAGSLANLVAVPWWSGVVVPLALIGTALDGLLEGMGTWAWWLSAKAFGLTWGPFQALASWSGAMAWLPLISTLALILACVAAFWMTCPAALPHRSLGAVALLPMLFPFPEAPVHGAMEMTVLDVGQGLAVHVRTRSHELLYDAGPARPGARNEGELTVLPYLRARGVGKLDRMMISHGDNDHAGGAQAVIEGIEIGSVWAPAGSKVPRMQICRRGQQWSWDGVQFEVLWPLRDTEYLANDSSCVLRIKTKDGAVLLTGDIGEQPEADLVAMDAENLRADIVTAPHHGSLSSSSVAFVKMVRAKAVLAGTGYRNQFRHPRPEVVKRWTQSGTQFHETAAGGAFDVRAVNGQWQVTALRQSRNSLWDAEKHRRFTVHRLSYTDD